MIKLFIKIYKILICNLYYFLYFCKKYIMTEKDRLNKAEEYILAGHKYLTFYESNVSYKSKERIIDFLKNDI